MIIDKATGLPEVPEDHYWAVVEGNSPVKGTLRVELRFVRRMQISNIVDKALPKKWYHIGYTPMARLVVWETVEDYSIPHSENLIDTHVWSINHPTQPVGDGWELAEPAANYTVRGSGFVSYSTTTTIGDPLVTHRYYRRHPNTPESVLAAATKIYERMEAAQEAEAARLRGAEDRAKLIGKYPPNTLKG